MTETLSAVFNLPGDGAAPVIDWVSSDTAAIAISDLVVMRGDGIFETLMLRDGHVQEFGPHFDRFVRSARLLELPAPDREGWRKVLAALLTKVPAGAELQVRMCMSRGVTGGTSPTSWVQTIAMPDYASARQHGVRTVTLSRGYPHDVHHTSPWLLQGAKTLSYASNMATLRETQRRGADDAIYLSTDDYVLEAPTSSVVLRFGGTVVTPDPESCAILVGTTQQSVFRFLETQHVPVESRKVRAHELKMADAIWLVSSVRLASPVIAVDKRELPIDRAFTDNMNKYLLSKRD